MLDLKYVQWSLENAVTDAMPVTLDVATVQERLSGLYEAKMMITANGQLEPSDLLGKDAALVFSRAQLDPRRVCGIIQNVELEGNDSSLEAGGVRLELSIRPAMWMLTLQRDSRIFQGKSAPDIVKEVLEEALGPYGREVQVDLTEEYPTREYCVQYQETNYDFVARLLAEEGIRFSFDHEGPKEIVILRDKNASFEKLRTLPEAGVLHFDASNRGVREREWLHVFTPSLRTSNTKVTVRDSDFTRGGLFFDHEEEAPDPMGRVRESYEHGSARSLSIYDYDQGVRRYQKEDSTRQAALRLETLAQEDVVVYSAASTATHMAPGTVFEVRDLGLPEYEGEWVVTRVSHTSVGTNDQSYSNHFDCIPVDKEFRPTREYAKPRIPSIQTAIVTGPAGEEIHVDEYGRIKVQFYWDRVGALDEVTSCWVRTQQTWAGNGFGTWWVPRIGMEVIVQFVDGDPDRPLVTGCVYNADNALPYALPDEKTKSTIKSNSSLGGGGFNEFRFEDKAGEEEIWLHAQKDLNEKVLNDHTLWIGHDETLEVINDQTQTIGNNQVEHVKANQTLTVDVDRTVTVTGNFTETVVGNETRTVNGAIVETINSGETRTVNAGQTVTINAGSTATTNGGATSTTNGGSTSTITGGSTATVIGGSTTTIVGGQTVTVTGTVNNTATAPVTNVAPQIQNLDPDNTTVSATCTETTEKLFKFTGLKTSTTGLSVTGTIASVSVTGAKASATGVDASVTGHKVKTGGTEEKAVALNIKVNALMIFM